MDMPLSPHTPLALTSGPAQVQVVIWVVVLIAAVLVAFVLVYFLHKKLFREQPGPADTEGLMETMRRLKARGEMTQEEFDQAKRALQRKTVADVEARIAARQQERSPEAKREAAQAAAEKLMKKEPPRSE